MSPAQRHNAGKPELGRVLKFGSALDDLAAVMARGAEKYAEDNWLIGGKPLAEYIDSATRHLRSVAVGEVYDGDLGTKHLAMAAWNCLAALRLIDEHAGPPVRDERW